MRTPPHRERKLAALERLLAIVTQLRSPEGGCPWDRAQTPQSLIPYVLEEAHEVVAAIRGGDPQAIAEELGDLLLQVVLQAQIAEEAQDFDMGDVATRIGDKLVRRHPHVFGEAEVADAEAVHRQWETIKAAEKGEDPAQALKLAPKLEKLARSLPPLLAATRISEKSAAEGMKWEDIADVWAKFDEELAEFQYALNHQSRAEQLAELGDIFFSLVNVGRWYGLDASTALHQTNRKYAQRVAKMEALSDRPLRELTLAELDTLWDRAKAQTVSECESL
ncbi:MAG: nucleoside triphosphate pyrophosphohydrolase [Pseudanabaenaceae cyanobacterium]